MVIICKGIVSWKRKSVRVYFSCNFKGPFSRFRIWAAHPRQYQIKCPPPGLKWSPHFRIYYDIRCRFLAKNYRIGLIFSQNYKIGLIFFLRTMELGGYVKIRAAHPVDQHIGVPPGICVKDKFINISHFFAKLWTFTPFYLWSPYLQRLRFFSIKFFFWY